MPGEANPDARIFFTTRLPRVLFGAIAGACLALAGAVYQCLLRNDLADPYTLGVSGGASFGALLMMRIAPAGIAAVAIPLAAFVFAAIAVAFVYMMARAHRASVHPARLLLAGVSLNFFFASGILLIQYLSDPYQTYSMIRWMMGGVDVLSLRVVGFAVTVGLLGSVVIFAKAPVLNLLSLGESTAAHLGVDVERSRLILLGCSSVITAAIVAYAGPIGFVGLIVPHLSRLVFGADHRVMLPSCFLIGGSFLVVCDTIARTVLAPSEIPVGIITVLTGAPFFIWLLYSRR